jgi:hypothetical protein
MTRHVLSLLPIGLALLLASPMSHAQISVRGPLSNDIEVRPGAIYTGQVTVANETDTPQQARLYLTDYHFQADGTNDYATPGSTPRSNADWIQFTPSVLTLPPGESLPVQYTVTVPADSLDGSYWSLLMVEAVPPGAPESTLPGASAEPRYGVRPVMRYGIQIATHVQGTGAGSVRFANSQLVVVEGGVHQLVVDVANEGNRMIRPEVWAEVVDSNGASLGRLSGSTSRIYPGTSVRQTIPLGTLPSGQYSTLVVVDAGGDDVYGAEYEVEI